MAKPTPDCNSASTSSIFLPQLRNSRRGSLTSLSATAQLDKETLAQALDEIHSSACQTESLTTFNEFTSPPSSSSGADGKGLASELQGGLSGLYSRIRASVGNVRDIVTLSGEDGSIDDKSLKSYQGLSLGSKNDTDPAKLPSPSVTSIGASQGSEKGVHDDDQRFKGPQHSQGAPLLQNNLQLGSVPQPCLVPLKQGTPGVAARPAIAEINVNAVKDLNQGVDGFLNDAASPRSLPGSRVEARLSESVDKPSNDAIGSSTSSQVNKTFQPQQVSRSMTDKTIVPSRSAEIKKNKESKTSRKSVSVLENDYFLRESHFDNTENLIQSGRDRSTNSGRVCNDAPRIITNPATPRTDPAVDSHVGVAVELANPGFAKEGTYQHLELPNRKSSKLMSATSSRSSDTHGLPQASEITTVIPHKVSRQQFLNDERMGNLQRRNDLSTSNRAVSQKDSDPRSKTVFSQIKSKVLNKEYWMRDENARDCFYCGDPFSTFRRKHHCSRSVNQENLHNKPDTKFIGTCGQIFDAKCTSLLSGAHFGQSGSLRVCKPCEGIINDYDDSSEFSDDSNVPMSGLRPRHGSTGASDTLVSPGSRSSTPMAEDLRQSPKHPDLTIPTMAIPATRRAGGESSKKPILEIDGERTLLRPSSSRSLKSSLANRPYVTGHRRFNSRLLNQRGLRLAGEESAPFHRNLADEKGKQSRLRAFHDDNIIDPDLAPFLSDEGSSGDEQVSIMTAMNDEGSRSYDNERHGITGLLSSAKKGRSRIGDKSISGITFASRDTDNISLSSHRSMNLTRSSKRRNLSVSSNLHLRPSSRIHRPPTVMPTLGITLHEDVSKPSLGQMVPSSAPVGGVRMIRSSSMRGAAAPAIELNNASLEHVRKLLRQLLQDSNVPSVANWEKALIPILLQATDDVNPDVTRGDDIDIRHYVKLKKISGGRPGDTAYVSGLVFTKNLALKSMPRSIRHPHILILTFALEYARHQRHFMSLEPVIRQEREYLQNLVNRIVALRPQLLLVERNVSGLALEFLEQANIATAYNVKASVLEAVSRCTQTKIISSIDKLAVKPAQTGECANFYLKTYLNGGRKKTYTFLSGCAKELGCTIVLRGAKKDVLAKIKRITEFMVYVVYNLKLETCLMRDEFALIPSNSQSSSFPSESDSLRHASPSDNPNHARHSRNPSLAENRPQTGHMMDLVANMNAGTPELSKSQTAELNASKSIVPDDASMPEDVPMPTFYGDMVEQHKTKILSASPFVKFAQPYLLMRAREQERRLAYLKRLRDQDILDELNKDEVLKPQKFDLIKPEMIHENFRGASKKVREVIHAVHDAEYDKALHNYKTHTKQWEAYIAGNINMFDPYEHQNIAVLYSVVCTITTVPCSGPDLLALGFYNEHEVDEEFEADCTLGQYVEDLCLGANTVCTANGCEKKMFDHHRQYVHGEAQVSVFVERYPCRLRGLQDTILMWSCCRICGNETQVLPMSASSWKYSFGKYLELSFWSSNLRARADVCPHDLHRDHLRYFGFQDMALRLHYDRINLLEIVVPRARITWKVDNDLGFKNEFFGKIEERLNKYMASVKNRLKSIKVESIIPEKTEICKQQVNELLMRANDEHKELLQKLQELYMDSKHYEIIPLNQALRATQEKVAEWDNAFADFDRNFFPSEKDIRRLTTLQLKKIFLDRDESNTSLNSTDDSTTSSVPEETLTERSTFNEPTMLTPQTRTISPEKAHDMLASVVKEHSADSQLLEASETEHYERTLVTETSQIDPSCNQPPHPIANVENVQHLDLAVAPKLLDTSADVEVSTIPNFSAKILTREDLWSEDQRKANQKLEHPSDEYENKNLNGADIVEKVYQRKLEPSEQTSGIPRISDLGNQRVGLNISPPLHRAKSQPVHVKGETVKYNQLNAASSELIEANNQIAKPSESILPKPVASTGKAVEKRLTDRLGLGVIKQTNVSAQSMIPRSVATRRKDSNVSNLAKHFEQLSREFEKERIRDRRQRAAKFRQSRAYPMAAPRPIVEIYRNVYEAVEEREPSDEDLLAPEPCRGDKEESLGTTNCIQDTTDSQPSCVGTHIEDTTAETTETEEINNIDSQIGSDAEGEGGRSEEEHSLVDEVDASGTAERHDLVPSDSRIDLKLDLPRHEKTSLMKMLTNFWAERSASGWQSLDYPLNASDHIFADSDIIVREDEPSSLISFALDSEDYQTKLRTISETFGNRYRRQEKALHEDSLLDPDDQLEVERSLLRSTGTHLKYQFQQGSAKMLCKVFFAEQFDAVRRKCGVDERIIESLSRCMKWDSKGGKTKSVFLKTSDDRLVLKSLSPIETQAFLRFAPAYFRIMSEALFHELPSVIAKMLGFYQVIIKNPVTGVDFNWFLLLMENLFYDRSPTRIFDLKGSMRNRRIQSTGEQNEVLLDENMVEFIYESPLFAREHSKRILRASVWNDTLFLARQNVMDYSLMIAIDENRKELVIGIIDCIRTYTWDKKLETWIKDRGKNRPTVTSPREYKNRFREAMGRYVLQAPK